MRLSTPSPSIPRSILLLVGLIAMFILTLALPANAHSGLLSAVPAADEVTDTPPEGLTLTFGQPVNVLDGGVAIVDQSGTHVPTHAAVRLDDGVTVTVALTEALAPGDYTVVWRVIGGDGHPIEGTYAIGVAGTGGAAPATIAPAEIVPEAVATTASQVLPAPPAADDLVDMSATEMGSPEEPSALSENVQTVARWLAFLGILAAIGVVAFGIAVHPDSPADQHILTQIAVLASVVTVAASVLQLLAHVAVVSGSGLGGMASGQAWTIVAGGGTFTATTLRIAAGALIGVAAAGAQDWSHRPSHAVPLVLGAVGLLVSFQFTGHTATTAPSAIVRAADAAHVLGAAVWSGGAVTLAMVMGGRRRRGLDNGLIVSRFSVAATGAVVLVGLAGTALAVVELNSVASLVTSAYGQILLGKILIVAVVGAAGAYNHTRMVPAIVGGQPGAARQMQRVMRLELALFPLAIALTAVLVRTSP